MQAKPSASSAATSATKTTSTPTPAQKPIAAPFPSTASSSTPSKVEPQENNEAAGDDAEDDYFTRPRAIPANVDKAKIIEIATKAYLNRVYEDFTDMAFLEDIPKEEGVFIDWDTILSDPLFIETYPDPMTILGPVLNTRTTQGFMTSMECWNATMQDPCHSFDTPERDFVASIKKFIITLDMSLPENIEPTWTWDKQKKILTTTHNPLSFIDGIQRCLYVCGTAEHPGRSNNWFPGLWWVVNDGFLPYMPASRGVKPVPTKLIQVSGFNLEDNPQLAQVARTKITCHRCEGKGWFGSRNRPKHCGRCKGTGKW